MIGTRAWVEPPAGGVVLAVGVAPVEGVALGATAGVAAPGVAALGVAAAPAVAAFASTRAPVIKAAGATADRILAFLRILPPLFASV